MGLFLKKKKLICSVRPVVTTFKSCGGNHLPFRNVPHPLLPLRVLSPGCFSTSCLSTGCLRPEFDWLHSSLKTFFSHSQFCSDITETDCLKLMLATLRHGSMDGCCLSIYHFGPDWNTSTTNLIHFAQISVVPSWFMPMILVIPWVFL